MKEYGANVFNKVFNTIEPKFSYFDVKLSI